MAYIVLADSDHEIDRRELIGPVIIGRALDCSLAVHDALLSRKHCSLERFGNDWVLRDLRSKNGTFVNSQLIESHLLKDGDIVRIGKTRVFFRTSEFIAATDQQPVSKLLRPVDPREAMASSLSGFKYFEEDDTERQAWTIPETMLKASYFISTIKQTTMEFKKGRTRNRVQDIKIVYLVWNSISFSFILPCSSKMPSLYIKIILANKKNFE